MVISVTNMHNFVSCVCGLDTHTHTKEHQQIQYHSFDDGINFLFLLFKTRSGFGLGLGVCGVFYSRSCWGSGLGL